MDIRELLLPSRKKPDDYRRSKLVLILLISSTIFALCCLFIFIGLILFAKVNDLDKYIFTVFICSGTLLIAVPMIALINRFYSSFISATLFLLVLLVIIMIFNSKENIINGYGLFWFSIPIVFASFILFSYASYIMAAFSTIILFIYTFSSGVMLNIMAVIGFFVVASISFLSVKSMENIVKKLEIIANKLQDDLTKQKEEQRKIINDNKAKNLFISNITHEIRTPMSAILGISKYLNDHHSENLSPDQKEGLTMIYQSCKKLLMIVTEVLELSKIEAGKIDVFFTHFSINDLISELKDNINSLVEQKALIIYFQIDSALPEKIFTDRKKIFQVLFTLMSSIVKYIDKGEMIFHAFPTQERINFSIRITGLVIPRDQLAQILSKQEFREKEVNELYAGIDLGINLCKKMISLLKGGMEMTSEFEKEATIQLSIPFHFISREKLPDKQVT